MKSKITCLFVDIGGVLLSNGWDLPARKRVVRHFRLDFAETEYLHHLTFDTFEEGKLSLDGYLDRVVFHRKRNFSKRQFRELMLNQSQPFPKMLALIRNLKENYRLKVVAVSNEGRELNSYRIRKFKLNDFVDTFISSCYVHIRKPDVDIFRLALDTAQVRPQHILYLENTRMFVEVAEGLGIRSILHEDSATTRASFASYGLVENSGGK